MFSSAFWKLTIIVLFCNVMCKAVKVTFNPNAIEITMNEEEQIEYELESLTTDIDNILFASRDGTVAKLEKKITSSDIGNSQTLKGNLTVSGIFLGRTNLYVQIQRTGSTPLEILPDELAVTVIREDRAIDHIFTGSVIVLVSILYVNFGAALNLDILKKILKTPIGPAIGFFCQFAFMPIISYLLGLVLFPDKPELHLGMFFTGVSPAGGASNIWTAILNGNLNLSIAMTSISTFAAFGMMPFWIFTLGSVIFERADLVVPYMRIAYFAVGLVIPLGVGLLIQKYLPKVSKILVKILKPASSLLILFIVVFAIVTNLYLFELFTWEIIVAGLGLPWLGYMAGWLLAKAFKQPPEDALAIAIETGIQNTGLSIFILRVSLSQPAADLTTVIPVAVAIMTPFPLLFLFIVQRIRQRFGKTDNKKKPIENSDSAEGE